MFSITLYTFKVDSYLIVFHSFLSLQFMSSVYFYGHVICIGWLLVYYAGLGVWHDHIIVTLCMCAVIAEPLGEVSNRGARSRNAFVCMYIYISVPVNYCRLDRLRNR